MLSNKSTASNENQVLRFSFLFVDSIPNIGKTKPWEALNEKTQTVIYVIYDIYFIHS